MPRVIHINILGYKVRACSNELVEPYKIMYTKEPWQIAIPNFSGYNIQLPVVPELVPDFTNDLYAWCYTMYTAHAEMKSAKEVVAMIPDLLEYLKQEPGLAQFCERNELVASDPKTRQRYMRWVLDRMKYEGELEGAEEVGFIRGEKKGLAEGLEKGLEKGKAEGIIETASRMLRRGMSVEHVIEFTGLSESTIEELQQNLHSNFQPA